MIKEVAVDLEKESLSEMVMIDKTLNFVFYVFVRSIFWLKFLLRLGKFYWRFSCMFLHNQNLFLNDAFWRISIIFPAIVNLALTFLFSYSETILLPFQRIWERKSSNEGEKIEST